MKKILPLVALLSLSSCDDGPYDLCMDEVSEQTGIGIDNLKDLTCEQLVEKLEENTGFQSLLPEDYIVLMDKNSVVVTHCSLQSTGDHRLRHNQNCYEKINDFLGIQPITKCIIEATSFQGDLFQFEGEYVPGGAASCLAIRSKFGGEKADCKENFNELEVYGCNAHEPTHLFVAGTVLEEANWYNEGLADYAMFELSDDHTLECTETGFRSVYKPFLSKQIDVFEGFYDDFSLHSSRDAVSRDEARAIYLKSACVWEHIDKKYGHKIFKKIMKEVANSRFTCMSFVDDILESILTESQLNQLEKKFGEDSICAYD